MPASILGLSLSFGAPTLSGMVVESVEVSETHDEEVTVKNEQGDYVAVALASRARSGSISGILNGGSYNLAAVLTLAGLPSGGTYYITEITRKRGNTEFESITLNFKNWLF